MLKPDQPAYRYYGRPTEGVPDGRQFNQRTLKAVNTTAYDVTSYRQLIIAITESKSGDTIHITETVSVPKTIIIEKPLTILCSGRGKFVPTNDNINLFSVLGYEDTVSKGTVSRATGCIFDSVVVRYSGKMNFNRFIEFKIKPTPNIIQNTDDGIGLQNITITGCRVQSAHFLYVVSSGSPPNGLERLTTSNDFAWKWVGQRSYIENNVHIVSPEVVFTDKFFIGPQAYMCTVKNNETQNSHVRILKGTGNFVCNNLIAGVGQMPLMPGTSSIIIGNQSTENVITENIVFGVVQDDLGTSLAPAAYSPYGGTTNTVVNNRLVP